MTFYDEPPLNPIIDLERWRSEAAFMRAALGYYVAMTQHTGIVTQIAAHEVEPRARFLDAGRALQHRVERRTK